MGHRDTGREQVFPWSSLFFFQVILLSGTLLRPQLHQMEPVLMNTQGILSHSSQSLASCWGPTSVPNLTYGLAGYIHVAYRFFQTVASLLFFCLLVPPPPHTHTASHVSDVSFFFCTYGVSCICAHVWCVETKGLQRDAFLGFIFTLSLSRSASARMAGQRAPGFFPSLLPSTGILDTPQCSTILWVLEVRAQVMSS